MILTYIYLSVFLKTMLPRGAPGTRGIDLEMAHKKDWVKVVVVEHLYNLFR